MVIFQTPDGNPGYNQFETLDEAVRFVEKLRNEQSVETARMFALEEVKFDFKPYFKVELDPPMVGTGSSSPSVSESSSAPVQNGTNESPSFTPPSPPSAPATPPTPSVSFGEPPAPPAVNEPDSPVGPEPATVGAATPPPPTFMAPPAPPQANEESQTTRRGLFGR
jgi:hypothetical protein